MNHGRAKEGIKELLSTLIFAEGLKSILEYIYKRQQ